ncbi:hypothetical protein, partial [Xylella fastidiosa]|uniref:hypothetical protein n=2 Tax=Xylella fastidiosa TaxID=2371 RepID=UPI000AECF749
KLAVGTVRLHYSEMNDGHKIGSGSTNNSVPERIAKLEAVLPTLATKTDVEKASHEVAKWVVGTMVGGVGLFIVIMTFVLNNAVPKTFVPTGTQPSPIIIQVPAQALQPPPQAK